MQSLEYMGFNPFRKGLSILAVPSGTEPGTYQAKYGA